MRRLHTREHHSAIKRAEVLTHITAWENPESITPSEQRLSQKTVLNEAIYMECPEQVNPQRQKEDGGFQRLGEGEWG